MMTVTIWLSFAFALGLTVRLIGLPPLVGYLAAGFLLSYFGHDTNPVLKEVSHAGILLLLFSVGLKLRLKSLIRLEVLVGSLVHMLITIGFVYFILILYFQITSQLALIFGVILSFSSTVVAIKVLESKKELRAFHGRSAIGILIMQDIIAVIFLSVDTGITPSPWAFSLLGLLLLRPLIHRLLDMSGHGELVILYGLLAALVIGGHGFEYFGLSSELGSLLIGMMIASHKRAIELSNSIWSLKEILLVGFFLQIGLIGHPSFEMIQHAFLINFLVPLKALLFFFILVLMRFRARTAFLTSLTLATFSEFGLIVASIGVANGLISNELMVMLAVAVAMSFTISAPLNRYAHNIYSYLEKFLYKFETSKRHPDDEPINIGNSHIVVMGMGRVGTGAYDLVAKQNKRVIGLDSDPIKVEQHRKQGRRVLYADAEDPGLWSNLQLGGVQTIMLAMPEFSAKILATKALRKTGFKGTISTTVIYEDEIEKLEKAGADLIYNYYNGLGESFALHSLGKED